MFSYMWGGVYEHAQRQERNREAQQIKELEDVQRELRALKERRSGHTCVMCNSFHFVYVKVNRILCYHV